MDYRDEAPEIVRDFLGHHESILGHSKKTIDEYYLDIRTFLRFLKLHRSLVSKDTSYEDIQILDIELEFLGKVTRSEVYAYLAYLSRDRVKSARSRLPEYGISASSRSRKLSALNSLFNYLTVKTKQLKENPLEGMDMPKIRRTLPKYLTLNQSRNLLNSVNCRNSERDLCILTIFLNCGIRVSELVGLNLSDIKEDHLRIVGKGGKERTVYLNDSTAAAINDYLQVRKEFGSDLPAFFLSERKERISRSTVNYLVKKHIEASGLSGSEYSSHKLRHTAATLMLGNGVNLRALQELLGHEHLNTTEIYTHIENTELKIAAQANPLSGFIPDVKKDTVVISKRSKQGSEKVNGCPDETVTQSIEQE